MSKIPRKGTVQDNRKQLICYTCINRGLLFGTSNILARSVTRLRSLLFTASRAAQLSLLMGREDRLAVIPYFSGNTTQITYYNEVSRANQ